MSLDKIVYQLHESIYMNDIRYPNLTPAVTRSPSEQRMGDQSSSSLPEISGYFGHRSVRLLNDADGTESQGYLLTARTVRDSEILFDGLMYIKNNLEAVENYKGELERDPKVLNSSSNSRLAQIIKFIRSIFEKLGFISVSISNSTTSNKVLGYLNDILKFYYEEFGKRLEVQMLALAARTEEISNISKNLMDLYDLTVNKDENIEHIADSFIQALKESSESEFKSFRFKGKEAVVSEENKSNLESLFKNFTGENHLIYRGALIEYLKGKKAQSEGIIHFSTPLLGPIKELKTKEEAQIIAFYLMAEICKIKGSARVINLEQLNKLVNDPLIKNSSLLTEGVWSNAKKVTLQAIRQKQSNIVWASKLSREDKQKLQEELDKLGQTETRLSFSELTKLAKKIGLNVDSFKSTEDLSDQIRVLEIINRASQTSRTE